MVAISVTHRVVLRPYERVSWILGIDTVDFNVAELNFTSNVAHLSLIAIEHVRLAPC